LPGVIKTDARTEIAGHAIKGNIIAWWIGQDKAALLIIADIVSSDWIILWSYDLQAIPFIGQDAIVIQMTVIAGVQAHPHYVVGQPWSFYSDAGAVIQEDAIGIIGEALRSDGGIGAVQAVDHCRIWWLINDPVGIIYQIIYGAIIFPGIAFDFIGGIDVVIAPRIKIISVIPHKISSHHCLAGIFQVDPPGIILGHVLLQPALAGVHDPYSCPQIVSSLIGIQAIVMGSVQGYSIKSIGISLIPA